MLLLRPIRARPISHVPPGVLALLLVGLVLQFVWHGLRPPPQARASDLMPPPSLEALRAASLGEPVSAARFLNLWLQAFDYQPGISIPFRELDYEVVQQWLDRILALDPQGSYPLLVAARLYGEVPVDAKQRSMMEWVYQRFLEDPNGRWRWLAHVTIVAKHRLKDLALARRYAEALNRHARDDAVPYWAKDMIVAVLEDMGEVESARILIGGLLAEGAISDPHEIWFLGEKLRALEARETSGNGTPAGDGDSEELATD